ncbi:hypothetical protein GRX03_15465 [Halovenus sp. WSH3]|uniref:Uncharacterized protein n=1 Tax=Halovenus carboxidivorans TaxID=2692199 RepID=A0A6B0T7S9_9EURY|nr:hypothetical protein [Halovenus carboxidivorans]MXR52997.1 hypothetical protein [Halovenus carboxidivorans]
MYSLHGIRKGLANPRFILQELNRLYYQRLYSRTHNEDGLDIFAADWDTLVILDACRYDLFERVADLPGETTAVRSKGSATEEFLRGNFDGKRLHDTVYVTASPMLHRHRDDIDVEFHATVNVWDDRGWDDQYRTVLPETMAEETLAAAEQYPNKRILSHFLQPHYPFLGETGAEWFDLDRLDFQWEDVATGDLDIPDAVLERAYEETLEAALPSVERLLSELRGKTVVTADHGQMFGERLFPVPIREYGHPVGLYAEELVRVPWHVSENGPRREITAETPTEETTRASEDVATDRLRELGYLS